MKGIRFCKLCRHEEHTGPCCKLKKTERGKEIARLLKAGRIAKRRVRRMTGLLETCRCPGATPHD